MVIGALALIFVFALVNLAGALGPELSFDALYYHLTLPRLYLEWKKMPVIPGGLLYPSGQPQLMEFIYALALAVQGEILAKTIHWAFGLAGTWALYRILRRLFEPKLAVLGAMIFYITPVVGWLSTSAYIDLAVALFEFLAFDFFLRWLKERKGGYLSWIGVFLGLSLSSKFLSWGTLIIYGILLIFIQKNWKKGIESWARVVFFALLISWPWYLRTFWYTNNPFYPLFTNYTQNAYQLIEKNFLRIFLIPWKFTFQPDSLLTPIYLIFFPLAVFGLPRASGAVKIASFFGLLSLIYWFFIPPQVIRYLLPFTPGLIIFSLTAFKAGVSWQKRINKVLFALVFLTGFLHLGIRAVSNAKFIPVILGKESKREFLSKNLNFDYGDFYDVDGYFEKNIKDDDLVLIYGLHNLYYVNFPFVHESWDDGKTEFTHVLLRETKLPEKYKSWPLVYENSLTRVKLYQKQDEN